MPGTGARRNRAHSRSASAGWRSRPFRTAGARPTPAPLALAPPAASPMDRDGVQRAVRLARLEREARPGLDVDPLERDAHFRPAHAVPIPDHELRATVRLIPFDPGEQLMDWNHVGALRPRPAGHCRACAATVL